MRISVTRHAKAIKKAFLVIAASGTILALAATPADAWFVFEEDVAGDPSCAATCAYASARCETSTQVIEGTTHYTTKTDGRAYTKGQNVTVTIDWTLEAHALISSVGYDSQTASGQATGTWFEELSPTYSHTQPFSFPQGEASGEAIDQWGSLYPSQAEAYIGPSQCPG